jgi:hypothetical protein
MLGAAALLLAKWAFEQAWEARGARRPLVARFVAA